MRRQTLSRRTFVRSLGLLGLGMACAPSPLLAAVGLTEERRMPDNRYMVAENRFLMGTFVSISAVHESRTLAEQGVGQAFLEMERLCDVFDRHRGDTALSHLNATGFLRDADPELCAVVREAGRYARLSGGTFDATVLPVIELLKSKANPSGRMEIDHAELRAALELVDSGAVQVSGNDIRLTRQGMGLTLDGMSKGYIVDRASSVLSAAGVGDHLINAGGDMRASGERAQGKPWTVAVEDPNEKGDYPAVVHLRNEAIATSGGYEIRFDANGSHHHVIDPRTAMSPTRSVSVSVIAPTVMQADALSTAAFVLPPKEGALLVDAAPRSAGLIIANSGARTLSPRWENRI